MADMRAGECVDAPGTARRRAKRSAQASIAARLQEAIGTAA
jgi:hypothetical protein